MTPKQALGLTLLVLGSGGCARASREATAQLARERLVSAPSSIAYLSSARAASGLGPTIRFGGPFGRSALYLKFSNEWRARGIPRRAFLTLSVSENSATEAAPVALEAWRIDADWRPPLRHWSDKPSLGLPYSRIRSAISPAQELRIEVTELMRFAAQNPERDFGIAVIARGSGGRGAIFSTGMAGGRAPRLELYLR